MDPNANLTELRALAAELLAAFEEGEEMDLIDVARALELFEALDGWISRGGFLPHAWERK